MRGKKAKTIRALARRSPGISKETTYKMKGYKRPVYEPVTPGVTTNNPKIIGWEEVGFIVLGHCQRLFVQTMKKQFGPGRKIGNQSLRVIRQGLGLAPLGAA